jgi:hypothetical protein
VATRKNTAPKARPASADVSVILDRFSDARCVLLCAVRSLEANHDEACDEAVCLRHGLDLLASIYDDLDLAVSHDRL